MSQNDQIFAVKYLNLEEFATSLYYLDSGNKDPAPLVNITEVDAVGVQSLKAQKRERLIWNADKKSD